MASGYENLSTGLRLSSALLGAILIATGAGAGLLFFYMSVTGIPLMVAAFEQPHLWAGVAIKGVAAALGYWICGLSFRGGMRLFKQANADTESELLEAIGRADLDRVQELLSSDTKPFTRSGDAAAALDLVRREMLIASDKDTLALQRIRALITQASRGN